MKSEILAIEVFSPSDRAADQNVLELLLLVNSIVLRPCRRQ